MIALEIVGTRFAEIVRDGDTIARIGGDKLSILLEDLENDEETKRVAAAVIELMQTPIELDHAAVTVGVCIGTEVTRAYGLNAALSAYEDVSGI